MSLKTPRTTLKRTHQRGRHERDAVYEILDAGLFCHVGYVQDGQPFVTPTAYWRRGDQVAIHGSAASRMIRVLETGAPACITVTHVDGLVLARSAFHHSVNYRSVMLLGQGTKIEDEAEKIAALEELIERVSPGRWATLRPHTDQELKATTVLSYPIEEASAKVREGPPIDDEPDYALPIWAGVVPLSIATGAPVADPRVLPDLAVPDHARDFHMG